MLTLTQTQKHCQNDWCNVQEALKSLGRLHFYQLYLSFVLFRNLSPRGVNVALVLVAGACVEGKGERGQGLSARLLFVAEIFLKKYSLTCIRVRSWLTIWS